MVLEDAVPDTLPTLPLWLTLPVIFDKTLILTLPLPD